MSALAKPRRMKSVESLASLYATNAPVSDKEAVLRRAESIEAMARGELSVSNDSPLAPLEYVPGMIVQVGAQYLVPPGLLQDNPNNSRALYIPGRVERMADSLKEHGQLQAILVYAPTPEHPFFVIKEGHTRKRAMELIDSHKKLRVEVCSRPDSALEDYRQSRDLNTERSSLTVFDDALRFKDLLKLHPLTQEELAKAVRMSPSAVSKHLKIGGLPSNLVSQMAEADEPKFGLALAYAVAQVHEAKGAVSATEFVAKILRDKLSVRQVEALIARTLNKESSKEEATTPRRLHPTARTTVSGAAAGELKLFKDGRLEMALSGIQSEQLQQTLCVSIVKAFKEAGLVVQTPHSLE